MKRLLVLAWLLLNGCSSQYEITRNHNTFLRRMPQINRMDSGKPLAKGSFYVCVSGSYSLDKPEISHITDSSIETRSSAFGKDFLIITSLNAYNYESRLMASGEGMYAFSDILASGVSLDASLGKIAGPIPKSCQSIYDDDIEGAFFIRFAKQFDRLSVSIRPELLVAHLYGDRMFSEIYDTTQPPVTATERIGFYTLGVRSSSTLRYDLFKKVSPFMAFQIKTEPYLKANDAVSYEMAYGMYGGFDFQYKLISMAPYVSLPFGASTSHFKSPLAVGLQFTLTLAEKVIK